MIGWEEGLVNAVTVDGRPLERVSGFKYLGFVLEESGTDRVECCMKVTSEKSCEYDQINMW